MYVLFSFHSSRCHLMYFFLKGITPTTIVVRVGMGRSYDSQTLSVESNMRFAYANENSPTKISGSTSRWNSHINRVESKETV